MWRVSEVVSGSGGDGKVIHCMYKGMGGMERGDSFEYAYTVSKIINM